MAQSAMTERCYRSALWGSLRESQLPQHLTSKAGWRILRAKALGQHRTIVSAAFARDVADEIIFMDGGVIVEHGAARQVIEHPREERTKLFLSRYAAS